MQGDYSICRQQWKAGVRNRELALQLMFMAWMHWANPPFVTGLDDDTEALELWRSAFGWFGAETSSDAEFLAVSAVMIGVTPWGFGDDAEWLAKSRLLTSRAAELQPSGIPQSAFNDRGEYGKYVAQQFRSR